LDGDSAFHAALNRLLGMEEQQERTYLMLVFCVLSVLIMGLLLFALALDSVSGDDYGRPWDNKYRR
jgi:hypothetical protein